MLKRKAVYIMALMVLPALLFAAGKQENKESKWPERSIVVIVPFNPGGATDQIGRSLKPYMEEKLGVPIAMQNMAGGSTAVGHQYVNDAPHDGYTLLVQPTDITSIAVMGQSKFIWKDWHVFGVAAAVPAVFVVHPDSPIKDVKMLEKAMAASKLSCAVAGSGCAWTRGIALYAKLTDTKTPEMVPMGGGRPAAVSALKKEVDFACCGLPEAIDLILGKQVTAIASWGKDDIELPGVGTLPSLTKTYPGFAKYAPFGGWVGMAGPKDLPENVKQKIQAAYDYAVSKTEFKNFLKKNYYLEVGLTGKAAEDYVALSTSVNAWLLYELGIAPTSPDKLGIPKP